MKLVRLATENNGVFQSSFGNDMIIAKNSQMALLNLTFKSNIGTFFVVPPLANIVFQSDIADADSRQTVSMPQKSYAVSEIDEYYKDLQHTLNSALKDENSIGIANNLGYNSVFSCFRIGTNDAGLKTVEYRYAPFINPIEDFASPISNSWTWYNTFMNPVITGGVGEKVTTLQKQAGQPATDDRTYKFLPFNGRRLNDGNSLFTARILDLTTNGGTGDNNGFGIGLSKTNLGVNFDNTADIPASARDFEIRVNRGGEHYQYIDNGGDEKTSTVLPERYDLGNYPEPNVHDVLAFNVSGNILKLGVYQDKGPGFYAPLAEVEIQPGEELYPYLYIRGASTNCQVDMVNFSIDPFLPSIGGDERGNDEWQITGKENTGVFNGYDDVIDNSVIGDVIPQLGERFDGDLKMTLTMKADLLGALGFRKGFAGVIGASIDKSRPVPGFKVLTAQGLPDVYSSDNYIVESMSLPLDSFDASKTLYPSEANIVVNPETDKKGRRKNILMTIPENNNTNGLIEYESSTPIFIDLNNAEDINAKNLNFRLLDKDFSPIVQADETAIMTILIKKPGE